MASETDFHGETILKGGCVYSITRRHPKRGGEYVVIRPSWNGRQFGKSVVFGPFPTMADARVWAETDQPKAGA